MERTGFLTRRKMLKYGGLGAAAVALSALNGCTSPQPAPAQQPEAVSDSEVVAPTAAIKTEEKEVALKLWSMQYSPHDAAWKTLTEMYHEEFPNRTITVEPQSDWLTKYAAGLSAGTAGDLISVHGAGAPAFFVTGQLLPITEALGGVGKIKERFFPAVMDYYSYDGEVYGIPLHNNTPGIGFITNLDVWDDAGMTPPGVFDSWDQTWQTAKDLTITDDSGAVTLGGLSMRNYHNIQYLCGFILEQGGQYFDPQKGQWMLNTDEAVEGLTKGFYDPIFTHKVDSTDLPNVFDGLAEGRMAMGGIWIDYIPYGRINFPDKRFGFTMRAPLAGDKAMVVGEGGWGLNVNAKTKDK
ncbi:MAG: ABC transporter substrate-binding protein, partial [Anaerolineae bacterium]